MKAIRLNLLFRAVLFSLVLNLQPLVEVLRVGTDSPRLLSNIDEFHYLPHVFSVYHGESREEFYRRPEPPPDLSPPSVFSEPTAFIDFAVGAAGEAAGLSPQMVGLLLDLLCAAAGYLIFSRALLRLIPNCIAAEALAVVFLAVPIGTKVISLLQIELPSWGPGGFLVSTFPRPTDGVPILRGVYTQLALLGFGWSLQHLFTVLSPAEGERRPWKMLGLSSGLLLYQYFFAWGANSAICAIALAVAAFFDSTLRREFSGASQAAVVHVLIIVPGILILGSAEGSIASGPLFRQYWFVPLESLLLCLFAGAAVYLFHKRRAIRVPLILIFSCLAAYPVLMNLQPLAGSAIAPYRFPTLFLFPLAGICLLAALLNAFLQRGISPKIVSFAAVLMAFPALLIPLGGEFFKGPGEILTPDWVGLSRFLRNNLTDRDVVAVMSFRFQTAESVPDSFELSASPNLAAYFSGRHILHQDWIVRYSVPPRENLERELLLGWLFTGKPRFAWDCLTRVNELPGDIFSSARTYNEIRRVAICRANGDLLGSFSVCEALRRYRPNYLLAEPEAGPEISESMTGYLHEVYRTEGGERILYKFDLERAIAGQC